MKAQTRTNEAVEQSFDDSIADIYELIRDSQQLLAEQSAQLRMSDQVPATVDNPDSDHFPAHEDEPILKSRSAPSEEDRHRQYSSGPQELSPAPQELSAKPQELAGKEAGPRNSPVSGNGPHVDPQVSFKKSKPFVQNVQPPVEPNRPVEPIEIQPSVPPPVEAEDGEAEITSHQIGPGKTIVKSLIWGVAGFVVGIAFWNAFGFWKFVGSAAFTNSGQLSAVELALNKPPGKIKEAAGPETTSSIGAVPSACVALVLDRTRNITFSRPCGADAKLLNSGNPFRTAKQDRTR